MIGNFLFLVEGTNEKIFYENFWNFLRGKNRLLSEIEFAFVSVNGNTRFENKAKGIALHHCDEHSGENTCIFLCYDTDALEEKYYPRESIERAIADLKNLPFVHSAEPIEASPSLERYFLEDPEALSKFLGTDIDQCKADPALGKTEISKIFKKANRIYTKKFSDIDKLVSFIDFEAFSLRHDDIVKMIYGRAEELQNLRVDQ